MNKDIQKPVIQYLAETIGMDAVFADWAKSEKIPYAMRGGYEFWELHLLGRELIAITPKEDEEFSAAKLGKHISWLDENYNRMGVFIANGLESYNRKRLIEQKVPFIVPGNQLYLPDLGIDFREHLRGVRKKRRLLSPSAQMVLLGKLQDRCIGNGYTATILAESFHSNKVTMGRAIDELESHNLVETRTEGREKQVYFKLSGRELWEKARPILRSPVQKRVFVENLDLPIGQVAGLSALAECSMLVEPPRKIRAVTNNEWKELQKESELRIIPKASSDMAPLELEIWKYAPDALTEKDKVDPLSLYLSLADTQDERVEAALDELLEDMPW